MKRLSSFTLLMLLLMLSTNAYAHDFQQKNGSQTIYYIWINNNTELAVSYRGSSLSQYSNHYVGKIVIPESVTHNGKTYSVTSIGNNAFYYCRNLTSVTIPNSVTSIGGSAFDHCTGLTSVTISNSVTSIGENAFSWCSSLTSVTIPNNMTSIGNSAFSDCSGLTSVTIGNSVTSIGNSAFQKCTGLTSVTIPNSVTSIGNSAFFGCTGLTTVTIPNSVTSIGNGAFSDCTGFTSIKVESENIRYDSRDNCNAIIETESNTLIAGCQNTIIPNNVTIIGNRAFSGCSGLTSITIPNSVTSIGNSAFWGCTGLTSVTIPNNVTSIGDNAFRVCTGLTSLTIGNSVTSIGRSAFEGCRNITTITSLNSIPPTIDWSTFFNMVRNYSATLQVPTGSKSAYQNAEYWKNFTNIVEVDPSGIQSITLDKDANAPIYDLNGRKLKEPSKGINIIGGKKVVVK